MNEGKYNVQFDTLCAVLELGEIIESPKAITGGLLHRMYEVNTTRGRYAIKALNPQIMLRPTAKRHTLNAERISAIALKNGLLTITAKRFNNDIIQNVENQHYLIFDLIDGRSLKVDEINTEHCRKIGDILAKLHSIDFSELNIKNDILQNEPLIDWEYYLNKGKKAMWIDEYREIMNRLYEWDKQAKASVKLLSKQMIISHRDLDPKNVMWNNDNPIIIDWESSNYINPMHELIETAIYWAEDENKIVDESKFLSCIKAYKKRIDIPKMDWKTVLTACFSGKLGWLEYSLKRSLGIESTDEKEQILGTEQVINTIKLIKLYSTSIIKIEKWLNAKGE
ncbi:phosphotransferase [Clostridiaceae bacterium M8S5]|nr:phosphotransferase [Clostridiaceae bacterium M8S5]